MLKHCGQLTKSRMAILDIFDGYLPRTVDKDPIANFRQSIGVEFLDYAMVYYPWLHTTIINDDLLSYENIHINSISTLTELLTDELIAPIDKQLAVIVPINTARDSDKVTKLNKTKDTYQSYIDKLNSGRDIEGNLLSEQAKHELNNTLLQLSSNFAQLIANIKNQMNLLPPSAAMAGVLTSVDNQRGVWKAPANVSLNSIRKLAVDISNTQQEDLNLSIDGKSVNAIRDFVDKGTLVWGARTLDGNSLERRYISVCRTIIMLEQSIKLACKAFVFESNDATTWTILRSMTENYLLSLWKRGALAGTNPDSAYFVSVGLGETMTPQDVLDALVIVRVGVALMRPAEFIVISFEQKMQRA